jgi:hypothetical protein
VGTFHPDAHALHGITCVVDPKGPRLYVGRVGTVDEAGVLLMGADLFEETPGGPTKAQFLERAARLGVWERLTQVRVPASEVASVAPLAARA